MKFKDLRTLIPPTSCIVPTAVLACRPVHVHGTVSGASLNGVGTRSLRTYPESTRYKTTGAKPPFPLAGLAPANLQLFDIQLIPTMLVPNLLTLTSEILDGYSFHSNGAVPYNPQKNNGCFRCARPKDRNNMLAMEKTDYTHRTNSLHDR